MAINQFSLERSSKICIATASFDQTIRLYDTTKLINYQVLSGHSKGVWTCDFNPNDPNTLISGSNDNNIFVWDLNSNQITHKLTYHKENVSINLFRYMT